MKTVTPCGHPDLLGRLRCERPAGHAGLHAWTDPEGRTYEFGPSRPPKRVRRPIEITLSPAAHDVLTRLAGPGGSRSAIVEDWLLSQATSRPSSA